MKPLILSTPQIHELQKSGQCVTVKVVKTCKQFSDWNSNPDDAYDSVMSDDSSGAHFLVAGDHGYTDLVKSPHQPGEQRWCKETFRYFDSSKECACYDDCQCARYSGRPLYKADDDYEEKWKSPVHMPYLASRFTLTCTAVNCEQRDGKWCWLTTWKLNQK